MNLALALSVGVAMAVAGLLRADARGDRGAALVWKSAASAGFVALAVAIGGFARDPFSRWVLAGLVLSAGGDVALALPGDRSFFSGLVLFLLGHVAYAVACAARLPIAGWPSVWALIPLAASIGAVLWLWPHLGSLRGAVVAYVIAITVMVTGALAVLRAEGSPALFLAAGALLFYASDLAVARDRFVAGGFVNRAWGLPAYYAGQVLIAWATA